MGLNVSLLLSQAGIEVAKLFLNEGDTVSWFLNMKIEFFVSELLLIIIVMATISSLTAIAYIKND